MSDGDSTGSALNPDFAEALLVGVAIVAVVLAAIIIPGPYPIETGSGGDGLGQDPGTSTDTPTPGAGDQSTQSQISIGNSSPNGIGFSGPPPEYSVGQPIQQPLAQIPLFVATSDEHQYWRQTSYVHYTGTSWEQAPDWQPFTGTVPNDRLTRDGEALAYDIELLVSAASLPTVWQPKTVRNLSANTTIQVAEDGGYRSASTLEPGATYNGRSARPAATVEDLRAAGRDYPAAIERQYTALPEMTPAEVGRFTDSITAGADSPYEQAILIRDWLQENKEYSLEASHEPGQPVVAQFLFEMETGYCQYFASAMAVMLRTQGIPARYVVGYTGGTEIGQNRTLVTSVNGHAWVEVYFPGEGWVRFDPTPDGRLSVRNPQPPYNISLNRSAVAGADVTISVEKNDTPVIGAPVYVGEQRRGWTDIRGNVSTRLPYKESFDITVRPPGSVGQPGSSGPDDETQGSVGGAQPFSVSDRGVRYSIGLPSMVVRQASSNHTPNQTTKTYRSDSNVTIRVSGTPTVGETVTVLAQIADVPMRNGTVHLDGELRGEMNETGQFALSLTGIEPGTHRVRVRRGPFNAGVQLEVLPRETADESTRTPSSESNRESLDLSFSRPLGWAFPVTPVTVTVERAGQPVSNATVQVGNKSVGRTDANGSLWAWLPLQDSVTFNAIGPTGATGSQTLSGLFANLGILLSIVLVLAGTSLVIRRRFDRPVGRVLIRFSGLVSALKRRVLNAIVNGIDRLIGGHTSLQSWLRSLGPRLAELLAKLRQRGLRDWPEIDSHRLYARLLGWVAGIAAAIHELFNREAPSEPDSAVYKRRADASLKPSLQELWAQFIRALPVSDVATKTPSEVAQFAINHGFPEGPVRSLTDAYRDAEYGHRQPDETLLERLRDEARSLLERAPDEEDTDSS